MADLAELIKQQAEKAVLKMVTSGDWMRVDYKDRVKLPPEFMEQVWGSVDQERIKQALARRLEDELANRIVNHMAAELATDIKQILSVSERREACRALARKHMTDIMAAGREA